MELAFLAVPGHRAATKIIITFSHYNGCTCIRMQCLHSGEWYSFCAVCLCRDQRYNKIHCRCAEESCVGINKTKMITLKLNLTMSFTFIITSYWLHSSEKQSIVYIYLFILVLDWTFEWLPHNSVWLECSVFCSEINKHASQIKCGEHRLCCRIKERDRFCVFFLSSEWWNGEERTSNEICWNVEYVITSAMMSITPKSRRWEKINASVPPFLCAQAQYIFIHFISFYFTPFFFLLSFYHVLSRMTFLFYVRLHVWVWVCDETIQHLAGVVPACIYIWQKLFLFLFIVSVNVFRYIFFSLCFSPSIKI